MPLPLRFQTIDPPPGAGVRPGCAGLRRVVSLGAISFLAVALSVVFFTPRIWFWRWHSFPNTYFETSRVGPLLAQLHDPAHWERRIVRGAPGTAVTGTGGAGASDWPIRMANALRWRLLPPILGGALHLGPTAYFGLSWVALVGLVGACVHSVRRGGAGGASGWLEDLSVAVLVATSAGGFVGTWFIGYFDAGYLLALVVAATTESPVLLAAACALGPWVDERFLLMLPAVLAIQWGRRNDRRMLVGAAVAVLPYLGVRLAAWACGDSSVPAQVALQSGSLRVYWRWLPAGWWEAFRIGWVPVLAGVAAAGSRLRPGGRWFLGLALAGYAAVISLLAWDSTRNAAALLPWMLVGAATPAIRRRLPWLAALNLVLPAGIWVYDRYLPFTSFWRR